VQRTNPINHRLTQRLYVCLWPEAVVEITFRESTLEAVPPCSGFVRLLVMSQDAEIYQFGGLGKNTHNMAACSRMEYDASVCKPL
jgi:hypothetical protein